VIFEDKRVSLVSLGEAGFHQAARNVSEENMVKVDHHVTFDLHAAGLLCKFHSYQA
jgi:hypothetical protein